MLAQFSVPPVFATNIILWLGVYDAFHRKSHVFLQAYNSYHAPMPMGSREVMLRLTYEAPL